MEQYEHLFKPFFGESLAARTAFLGVLAVFVGVPYLVRTWRDLKSEKYTVDLYRSQVELVSALMALADRLDDAEATTVREIARTRLKHIHFISSLPPPRPEITSEHAVAFDLKAWLKVSGLFILGAVISFIPTVFVPVLGLLIMLGLAAWWTAAGHLRRGTIRRRAFYLGLSSVPVLFLFWIIIWSLTTSS